MYDNMECMLQSEYGYRGDVLISLLPYNRHTYTCDSFNLCAFSILPWMPVEYSFYVYRTYIIYIGIMVLFYIRAPLYGMEMFLIFFCYYKSSRLTGVSMFGPSFVSS